MAEVNANSLPAKTDLGTNDSAIVVDQTTNAGALVDLDVLADKVLDRISSKTFANQVGGSSAATLLAQLSTLNSNILDRLKYTQTNDSAVTLPKINTVGILVINNSDQAAVYIVNPVRFLQIAATSNHSYVDYTSDYNNDGQTITRPENISGTARMLLIIGE